MAIQATVVGAVVAYRLHLAVAMALAAAAFSLASFGPSLATVAGFFWPLLVSTAALLGAVAILLRISPLPGEASGETSGEGLVDFVAGCAEVSQLAASGSYRHEGDAEPREEAEAEAERPK